MTISPVTRLQGAINQLERLEAESEYFEVNGWLAAAVDGCTCAGGTVESNYAHERGCGTEPVTNDPIMVTLHRTIDAQLAILRSSVEWFEKAEAEWSEAVWKRHPEMRDALQGLLRQELALADAILGGAK